MGGRWVRRSAEAALLALAGAAAILAGLRLAAGAPTASPTWMFDGMLLGILILAAPGARPARLGAAFLGAAAAWLADGGALMAGAEHAAVSLAVQFTALMLLKRAAWRVSDMETPIGLGRGAVIVLGAAPILPGLAVAALAQPPALAAFLDILWHWHLTEVQGLAIVTPLVLTLARRDAMLLVVPPLLSSTLVLVAVYAAIAAFVFLQHAVPLGFLLFPALLTLVGRLGYSGAGVGILVTALVAALGIALAINPLAIAADTSAWGKLAYLQFILVVASAIVYPMAGAVAERRRMSQRLSDQHARLSRNEHRYRLLADNASDIITRVRLDGRRLYVSPSVTDVLGWTPEEMMQPDWQRHVHPDDLPNFIAGRAQMAAGTEHISYTYRLRRRDDTWCWLEARLNLVRADDGRPKEFVANMRDVTRQKETELALEVALAELAEKAATDGLTGVANRRRFDEALDLEWRRAQRAGEDMAVILLDVDHFKAYNDRYGHQAGDDCLRAIATAIAAAVRRPHDIVARYGGEEFVVILPATCAEGAHEVGERIRVAVEALELSHEGNPDGVVTISVGVAAMVPVNGLAPACLVEAADEALYVAKRGGRNRVEIGHPRDSATVVPLLPHLRRAQTRAAASTA